MQQRHQSVERPGETRLGALAVFKLAPDSAKRLRLVFRQQTEDPFRCSGLLLGFGLSGLEVVDHGIAGVDLHDVVQQQHLRDPVDVHRPVQRLLFAGFRERAARVARATQDPAARHTANSLLLAADGNSDAALRSLERALEIAPTARSARLLLGRLRGFDLDALPVGLTDTDRAVIDASVLASQGAWDRVGELDPVLARMDPRNPIYADSVRLRIRWRLETGDAVRAREALGLVDAMLPTVGHITDRLLRARAAALLGETHAVVASLYEVSAAA